MEEYLEEAGFDSEEVLRTGQPGVARNACLALWLEGHGESNVRDLNEDELDVLVADVANRRNAAPPYMGKTDII